MIMKLRSAVERHKEKITKEIGEMLAHKVETGFNVL